MKQFITIKEFADERGVSYGAITQFLYRLRHSNANHSVINDGSLSEKDGVKRIALDSELYTLLDKKYPKPTEPVQIVQNRELIELHEKYERELEKSQKLLFQLAQLQSLQKQLEDSTRQKLNAIAERDKYLEESAKSKAKLDEVTKQLQSAEGRAESAEQKIDKMNKASLWKRIRKKW